MKELYLVTSEDCPLCTEALNLLHNSNIPNLDIKELDILSSDELHLKYWDKIPVLLYKDTVLNWPFNSLELKSFISNNSKK